MHHKISIHAITQAIKICETRSSVVTKSAGKSGSTKAEELVVGERLFADVIGPINGAYGLIFSDGKTKFVINRVLKTTFEVYEKFKKVVNKFINSTKLVNKTNVFIRAGNEFDPKINKFAADHGSTQFFSK